MATRTWNAGAWDVEPIATDNVIIQSLLNLSAALTCVDCTIQNGGTVYGAGANDITINGDLSVESGGTLDAPATIAGNVTYAAGATGTTESVTLTGASSTVAMNGVSLNSGSANGPLTIKNTAALGGIAFQDSLVFEDASYGVVMGTFEGSPWAGAGFTLAAASSNVFGSYTQTDGTCIDSGSGVSIAGDLEISGGTLTSTGIWTLTGQGNLRNDGTGAISELVIDTTYTRTLTGACTVTTLSGTTGTIDLAGFDLTVTTWEYTGSVTASATGNLPTGAAAYPVNTLTVSSGVTATLTGDLWVKALSGSGTIDLNGNNLYVVPTADGFVDGWSGTFSNGNPTLTVTGTITASGSFQGNHAKFRRRTAASGVSVVI